MLYVFLYTILDKTKTESVKRKVESILKKNGTRNKRTFDVAIAGAGYAGLSAALLLGRYLVKTVIFDGGYTRNHMAKHVHGYLGLENISPATLIKKAWREVARFKCIRRIKEKANSVRKNGKYFIIYAGGKVFRAKYLIIATGVKDVKPKIANFDKFDGNGAWHCPYCDGLETAGKRLAIIVSGKDSLSYVKEFLGWTRDIIVFSDENSIGEKEKKEAEALGIKIIYDNIQSIDGKLGQLPKGIVCKDNMHYSTNVIFYKLGYQVQSKLAEQLGCQLDEGYIKTNQKQETTIPNTYAAGDVDTDRHYVVLAAAAGARAAISVYEKILKDMINSELETKNRLNAIIQK